MNGKYYNTYRQCNERGRINLLNLIPLNDAFDIIKAVGITDNTNDFLKEHAKDITPDLINKIGNKFHYDLVDLIVLEGTDEARLALAMNGLVIREFEVFLDSFTDDELLLIAKEAKDADVRAGAGIAIIGLFDIKTKKDLVDFFLKREDYEAIIELSLWRKLDIDWFNDADRVNLLIACKYPNNIFTKELIEGVSPYGATNVLDKKTNSWMISEKLMYKEGVYDILKDISNKGINNLLYDLGDRMPDNYFKLCSGHTINSVIRYYLTIKGEMARAARLFVKAAELRPDDLDGLPFEIVLALDGEDVIKYDKLLKKALVPNAKAAYAEIMSYNMDDITVKISKGIDLNFREIDRLNIG